MVSWVKQELARLTFYKSSNKLLHPPHLNSQPSHDHSSTVSQVEVVVLAADLRCATCQNKPAAAMSIIDDIESMMLHVREKKATLTHKGSSPKVAASVYNNLAAATSSRIAFFSWHK